MLKSKCPRNAFFPGRVSCRCCRLGIAIHFYPDQFGFPSPLLKGHQKCIHTSLRGGLTYTKCRIWDISRISLWSLIRFLRVVHPHCRGLFSPINTEEGEINHAIIISILTSTWETKKRRNVPDSDVLCRSFRGREREGNLLKSATFSQRAKQLEHQAIDMPAECRAHPCFDSTSVCLSLSRRS